MVWGDSPRVRFIADCGVKACILEATAEKPGNITPTKGFVKTSYADFVAGSRALRPALHEAAETGIRIADRTETVRNAEVGNLILEGIKAVKKSHGGGNTHLGITMLFTPLSVGAGICLGLRRNFTGAIENAMQVMRATTTEDALNLYSAINAAEAGGMGSRELDVADAESINTLTAKHLTMFDVMQLSSEWDSIAAELTLGYPKSLESAVLMEEVAAETKDLNLAIIQSFLTMLSKYPDTLIARKCGDEAAEEVSKMAAEVLDAGGALTEEGKKRITELDTHLRSDGNNLNPGTTADITAAGLFLLILNSGKTEEKGNTQWI